MQGLEGEGLAAHHILQHIVGLVVALGVAGHVHIHGGAVGQALAGQVVALIGAAGHVDVQLGHVLAGHVLDRVGLGDLLHHGGGRSGLGRGSGRSSGTAAAAGSQAQCQRDAQAGGKDLVQFHVVRSLSSFLFSVVISGAERPRPEACFVFIPRTKNKIKSFYRLFSICYYFHTFPCFFMCIQLFPPGLAGRNGSKPAAPRGFPARRGREKPPLSGVVRKTVK